jgi:hypothetical protein
MTEKNDTNQIEDVVEDMEATANDNARPEGPSMEGDTVEGIATGAAAEDTQLLDREELFDIITPQNVSSQGYPIVDIGDSKLDSILFAMREIVPFSDFMGYDGTFPLGEGFEIDSDDRQSGAMFCCVDKISERAKIFNGTGECPLFIDGRMAAETGRVITILADEPDDVEYYQTTLFPQKEQEPEKCTAKATIYCGNFIAAIMVAQYTKWIRGEIKPGSQYRDMMFSLKTFELYPYKQPTSKDKESRTEEKKTKGGGKGKGQPEVT